MYLICHLAYSPDHLQYLIDQGCDATLPLLEDDIESYDISDGNGTNLVLKNLLPLLQKHQMRIIQHGWHIHYMLQLYVYIMQLLNQKKVDSINKLRQ